MDKDGTKKDNLNDRNKKKKKIKLKLKVKTDKAKREKSVSQKREDRRRGERKGGRGEARKKGGRGQFQQVQPPSSQQQKPSPQQHRTAKTNEAARAREKRVEREESAKEKSTLAQIEKEMEKEKKVKYAVPKEIEIPEVITIADLAKKMNLKAAVLIEKLIDLGVTATANEQIDAESAEILASEFDCQVKVKSLKDEVQIKEEPDNPEDLEPRSPIVTVMGHVDHGKTTLLDAIRNTNVVATESGGITQHIGAYQVETPSGKITFIDTPGHEAFTQMRARGANITDIVVLVVAADDGVMPQTVEALNHAKAAGVPIVVAVNKIDVPDANPDKVKTQLSERGLIPEDWGGDTFFVEVSALKKQGIGDLLDAILLVAEGLKLKANPKKRASGFVLESSVEQGKGVVMTVLVKNGTLKVGDPFVAGVWSGKVRAMFDDKGQNVKSAGPSTPVQVIGAEGLPKAGDPFNVVGSIEESRKIAEKRRDLAKYEEGKVKIRVKKDLLSILEGTDKRVFKVIVKADVHGTAEAVVSSIKKLDTEQVSVDVVHYGVGQVVESDIMLASASKATILAFRVRVPSKIKKIAEQEGVEIRQYQVIYDLIEDVKSILEGLITPEVKEEIVGTAVVKKVFKIKNVGRVAGCVVESGKIVKSMPVRIYRNGALVYDGSILSLKRFQDDVEEVSEGLECGISFVNFNQIEENDVIECYQKIEIKKTLDELISQESQNSEKG